MFSSGPIELQKLECLVFDCDGVILDSNKIKTAAFYEAALPYGQSAAQTLVEYHTANGGVSRYKKFRYFLEHIAAEGGGPSFEELLAAYALAVREGLESCAVAQGLEQLREITPNARWMVASGGDQQELREVFGKRDIAGFFDSGIYGSPTPKMDIVKEAQKQGTLGRSALLLGDSKYDHQVAEAFGLDFVFVSGWSEVKDWPRWVEDSSLTHVESIKDLLAQD